MLTNDQHLSARGGLLGEAARGDSTLCVAAAAVTPAFDIAVGTTVGAAAAFTAIAAGSS
jgi:hypothetical protein